MNQPNGPRIQVVGDRRDASRLLGIPALAVDRFTHTADCHWCDGEANNDTCPGSVARRDLARGLLEEAAS